jgi:hypothetical protein
MGIVKERTEEMIEDAHRISLPHLPPATPEEIERRRALFNEAVAFRERIGPIGISAAELVREVREEAEAESDGW